MTAPPRLSRLSGRANFAVLAASNVRARSGPIGVRWSAAAEPASVAVGYAVSRRQGNAVLRNRMRRRVRGVVRCVSSNWPTGNYLITLEAQVATMANEELRDHVERAVTLLKR